MDEKQELRILTINSGSSSVKFSIFRMGGREEFVLSGVAGGIGLASGYLRTRDAEGNPAADRQIELRDHHAAFREIINWLRESPAGRNVEAVGHRLVHGGNAYAAARTVTGELMNRLAELVPFAPDHLPHEIAAIKAFGKSYPSALQVACFDTAFHQTMPDIAKVYALPAEVRRHGVRRYGFHGLSYEYIVSELRRIDSEADRKRIVIAHLGNGASMAAIRGGKSMDTTMGFTPAGGLVMSTRSGDLDPGVSVYLVKEKNMDASSLNRVINKQAGLFGISETSYDIKDLLEAENTDAKAAQAVSLFCYQARKFLGALAAVLGGVDTLVFTGGIGEHAAPIRRRICENMGFLGICVDAARNESHADIISADGSRATVRVMKTNEELVIARHTKEVVLNSSTKFQAANFK